MTTNRLAQPSDNTARVCPPDMPRGNTDHDKAARVRFWIERGNENLAAGGLPHLEWRHNHGHYWIEPRTYAGAGL